MGSTVATQPRLVVPADSTRGYIQTEHGKPFQFGVPTCFQEALIILVSGRMFSKLSSMSLANIAFFLLNIDYVIRKFLL